MRRVGLFLGLSSFLFVVPALAGTLVFNTQEQWQAWAFPQGVIAIDADGQVAMRRFNRTINAALDAANFTYQNAKGDPVQGGIRLVGSNPTTAANIIDGNPDTWWQPEADALLKDWKIEIDLGRLVQVREIRLVFPDREGARPFEQFSLFASEGTRQVIGKDLVFFDRIGGTTQPSNATEWIFTPRILEQGNAEGLFLSTTTDDTLRYSNIQFIQLAANGKNLDAALAEVEVIGVGENIALGTLERGGTLRAGSNVQNIFAIADGAASKWWSGRGQPVPWRDNGMWFEWDLGATFWLDQLTIFEPRPGFATTGSNSHQHLFGIDTSAGAPVPTRADATVQSPVDYQALTFVDNRNTAGAGRNRNYDFVFPPRKVRYLFYHHEPAEVGPTSTTFANSFAFHLMEVFLYGEGYPAEVTMQSNFANLEGAKSLRRIRWEANTPTGTSIEIRSRTGDTLLEETFYYNKNGEEIPESLWNKLPNSQKQPLVQIAKPSADWSAWSPAYKVSGEDFLSPTPRALVQLAVKLKNETPANTPVLRSIALDFDDPLVSGGVFGQVLPREAGLDSLTRFRLGLQGIPVGRDQGYDRVAIGIPGPLEGAISLWIGAEELPPERVATAGDSLLEVDLPRTVRDEKVEFDLPLRLTRNALSFDAWVSLRQDPAVRQGIRPQEQASLTVFVPHIAASPQLLHNLELSTTVLTPNGDGVNDILSVDFLVLKTDRAPRVRVFDLAGRQVGELTAVGDKFHWDGRDRSGAVVPPGLYVVDVTLQADVGTEHRQQLVNLVY
ncbi:MAG: hypothetical protein GKR89_18235 [Candidatus Latescibacteria bacterium]|nr:hypothetical protein [Candidatus Latescibacterota bacterium]